MFKVTRKIAITSAIALTAALITTVAIVSKDTPATPQVKAVSTSTQSSLKSSTSAEQAATPDKKDSAAASNTPAAQRAVTTSNALVSPVSKSSATVQPTTPTSPASIAPAAPVSPTPQPTFHVSLRTSNVYAIQNPFDTSVKQKAVPFDITYDEGFAKVNYQQPGCNFISAPVADHGLVCNVGQKEADTGSLVVQYRDSSPHGHYTVQLMYPINNIQRTAIFEFDL